MNAATTGSVCTLSAVRMTGRYKAAADPGDLSSAEGERGNGLDRPALAMRPERTSTGICEI